MSLGKHLATASRGQKKRGRSQDWLHRVDVLDLLNSLNLDKINKVRTDEYTFSCPFDGHKSGDTRPSAFMNTGDIDQSKATIWICHGCGRAGNAIGFLAEHEGISKQEASRQLRDEYAPDYRAPKGGIAMEFENRLRERDEQQEREPSNPPIPWSHYDDLFYVDWEESKDVDEPEVRYLLDRGFTVATLVDWRIGYDERSQRLTIPVTNEAGELIGVKARTWKHKKRERMKYWIVGDTEGKKVRYDFAPYEKSLVIFGLDRAIGNKTVVLVEGELDVIALWQIGIPAISTGSAHLSVQQADLIRQHFDEIVVFFDTNLAGINATEGFYNKDGEFRPGVIQKLEPFIRVKIVDEHDDDASGMVQSGEVAKLKSLIDGAVPSHRRQVEGAVG